MNPIIDKMLSGRWILTVLIGVTLCVLAVKGTVSPDKFVEISIIIVYGYFTRTDRSGGPDDKGMANSKGSGGSV